MVGRHSAQSSSLRRRFNRLKHDSAEYQFFEEPNQDPSHYDPDQAFAAGLLDRSESATAWRL
jgi:hypothetical protein